MECFKTGLCQNFIKKKITSSLSVFRKKIETVERPYKLHTTGQQELLNRTNLTAASDCKNEARMEVRPVEWGKTEVEVYSTVGTVVFIYHNV